MTTGRRSSPIQQLQCGDGSAGCDHSKMPKVVQCKNQGSDGMDANWYCTADLDDTVKFGQTEVSVRHDDAVLCPRSHWIAAD